jgi:hypothetical protein
MNNLLTQGFMPIKIVFNMVNMTERSEGALQGNKRTTLVTTIIAVLVIGMASAKIKTL